jgi:hypothetical protein
MSKAPRPIQKNHAAKKTPTLMSLPSKAVVNSRKSRV